MNGIWKRYFRIAMSLFFPLHCHTFLVVLLLCYQLTAKYAYCTHISQGKKREGRPLQCGESERQIADGFMCLLLLYEEKKKTSNNHHFILFFLFVYFLSRELLLCTYNLHKIHYANVDCIRNINF